MAIDRVVVGVDFSTHGAAALQWTTRMAAAWGWSVEVIHVWSYPWWAAGPWAAADDEVRDEVVSSAARHLHHFVETHLPDGVERPTERVVEGHVVEVLLEESKVAAAVVIGCGGRGAVNAWMSGSVGRALASASLSPVIIVPDEASALAGEGSRVVVGVDGSKNSVGALGWAVDHLRTGQVVEAVTSWTSTVAHLAGVVALDHDLMETSAHQRHDDAMKALDEMGVDAEDVQKVIVYGDPRAVLRERAADADLLVVGSRGATGLVGVLLGSVTSSLVHRPVCPLVVVPAPPEALDEASAEAAA